MLPEAGYDTTSTEHTVQISDTQILGTKVVNETRFQYLRDNSGQTPLRLRCRRCRGFTTRVINVLGAFTGGRSSQGTQTDHQDHYELQNYTSISQGKHFVKFGGRLRGNSRSQYVRRRIQWHLTFASLHGLIKTA